MSNSPFIRQKLVDVPAVGLEQILGVPQPK